MQNHPKGGENTMKQKSYPQGVEKVALKNLYKQSVVMDRVGHYDRM